MDIYKEKNIPILNKVIINGLKINIRHWKGRGYKVLLLHGWMDCSASFQFLVDEFVDLSWDIYAPDWRGMGLSQKQEFGYYDKFLMLDDLSKIVDILSCDEPIHIVGHSLGGMIGILYSAIMSNRVRSLTLIEAFGVKSETFENVKSDIKLKNFLEGLKHCPKFSYLSSYDDFIKKIMDRNPYLTFDKARYLSDHLLTRDSKGDLTYSGDAKHKIENPYPYNYEWSQFIWSKLVSDILWIEGDLVPHNKYLSSIVDELDLKFNGLRNAYRKKIKDSGHMIHWERPKILAQYISDFLNKFE